MTVSQDRVRQRKHKWYMRNKERLTKLHRQYQKSRPKKQHRCLTCGIKLKNGRTAFIHRRIIGHITETT